MAKRTKKEEVTRDVITLKDLKVGDNIYLSETSDTPYTVLDVGDPFILIEEKSGFAYLYRVTKPIYINI